MGVGGRCRWEEEGMRRWGGRGTGRRREWGDGGGRGIGRRLERFYCGVAH